MTLELNKIHNIDVFEGLSKLKDESVNMIITDSPFGMNWQSGWHSQRGTLPKIHMDDNLDWFQQFTDECERVLAQNSDAYFFTRFDKYPHMYQCLENSGLKVTNLLIGQKNHKNSMGNLLGNYGNQYEMIIYCKKGNRKFNPDSNVVRSDGRKGSKEFVRRPPNAFFNTKFNEFPSTNINVSTQRKRGYEVTHPSEKSVKFIEMLLKFSSNKLDIVLDPFMGSGTTAISCLNTSRQFIGFEISKEYIDLANLRILNEVEKE